MNYGPQHFIMPPARPRASTIWIEALGSMSRFYCNKLRHGTFVPRPHGSEARSLDAPSSMVRYAHATVGEESGSLPYCVGHDPRGISRGAQPAWTYLSNFAATGRQNTTLIRRLLAQLPSGVAFHFVCSPDMPGAAQVRRAFYGAGFRLQNVETYIYTPPAGHADLIDTLSGKSIKGTLRRARRDLEIIEISVRDYFQFQRANLAACGMKNYRDDNLDQLMLEEALRRKNACILAARRKPADEHAAPHAFDAAIACMWNEAAGIFKLWRLTYRARGPESLAPHADASKLLILAAMQQAASRKLILDTDGSTPGLAKLYALFGPGIFKRTTRLQCERDTLWAIINHYYPSLGRQLGVLAPSLKPDPQPETVTPTGLCQR
jgi:hypothetical protein